VKLRATCPEPVEGFVAKIWPLTRRDKRSIMQLQSKEGAMFQETFLKLTRARRFRSGMIALCAIGAIVLVAVGVSPLRAQGTVTMRVDPATRAGIGLYNL
jgi:hypothetical protein